MEIEFSRNIGALSLQEQRSVFDASVCVVGCGGLGARAALLLAQAGVGRLTLIDPAALTEADLGRHPFATRRNCGGSLQARDEGPRFMASPNDPDALSLVRNTSLQKAGSAKALVTAQRLRSSFPAIRVVTHKRGVCKSDLKGHSLLMDLCDDPAAHVLIGENAACPVLHVRAYGFLVKSLIQPEGDKRLAELYADAKKSPYPPGKTAALDAYAAGYIALEAIKLLTGKAPLPDAAQERCFDLYGC